MKNKLLLVLMGLCLLGCSKDDNEPSQEQLQAAEYFVKYHFIASGGDRSCYFDIVYVDHDTKTQENVFKTLNYFNPSLSSHYNKEFTAGPFKYGDTVSIEFQRENYTEYKLLEISVSMDKGPFVLKAKTEGSKLEYTIGK